MAPPPQAASSLGGTGLFISTPWASRHLLWMPEVRRCLAESLKVQEKLRCRNTETSTGIFLMLFLKNKAYCGSRGEAGLVGG